MTALHEDHGYYVDLRQLSTDVDLAGELRTFNRAKGPDKTPVWSLVVEEDDSPDWGTWPSIWLDAGTAGSSGALQWTDRDGVFIPAGGVGLLSRPDEWLPYFDWSGVPCGVHVALEVPIEQVFAAVAELVVTRRRPGCVEWVKVDGDQHRLIGPRR
jgi:hypothetical protein